MLQIIEDGDHVAGVDAEPAADVRLRGRPELVEVASAAVQATLPLTEAASAHALLEDRSQLGWVLLIP